MFRSTRLAYGSIIFCWSRLHFPETGFRASSSCKNLLSGSFLVSGDKTVQLQHRRSFLVHQIIHDTARCSTKDEQSRIRVVLPSDGKKQLRHLLHSFLSAKMKRCLLLVVLHGHILILAPVLFQCVTVTVIWATGY